jgi:hypothetical protein
MTGELHKLSVGKMRLTVKWLFVVIITGMGYPVVILTDLLYYSYITAEALVDASKR